MKQFFNRADYRRGSILSMLDINRVKLFEAAGTLLVADKAAAESDAEDAVNIMRVVSIKNFKDDARVIVQVLYIFTAAICVMILYIIVAFTVTSVPQQGD